MGQRSIDFTHLDLGYGGAPRFAISHGQGLRTILLADISFIVRLLMQRLDHVDLSSTS